MPSVKNPNGPSKNRLIAARAKARKQSARRTQTQTPQNEQHRITKADAKRGARAGLLPTSGPNAAVSAKKMRKLQRKMGYALKRRMESEGEVEMKDVSEDTNAKTTKQQKKSEKNGGAEAAAKDEDMAVDTDDIS
ncbi:hypothetical protein GGR55DRAFT_431907 [Xylaria sp. FL0064]|nr:hypothetical protein GGR55DRAFT_431907 [Xylaria sp. FL0064]